MKSPPRARLKYLKSVLLREQVGAVWATVAAGIPVRRLFQSSGRCDGAYNRVATVEVVRSGWIGLDLEIEVIGHVDVENLV